MTEQRRMYIATETGIKVLTEDNGAWRAERASLEGKQVACIVAANATGQVYAGVRHDGVYRTSDGGRDWVRLLEADVHSLAIDPRDPSAVYAGTEPVHLFRSRDERRTWTELDGLQAVPQEVRERWWFPVYPHEPHVLTVCVSPHDTRQIYVGLEHGGILRSDDGGKSWLDVSEGIEYLDIHMVAADPKRQELMYAATARGFYRSEDYGHDWVLYDDGFARDYMHDFIVLAGDHTRLFMTTANGVPPNWMRDSGAESTIYRSDDEGLSWRQLGGGLPSAMKLMFWNVAGDPADPARLYAGAGDYGPNQPKGAIMSGELWMSADYGDSWTRVLDDLAPVSKVCVAVA
jgi:photosystem II stability/assembly factor-like uncharacterized protein